MYTLLKRFPLKHLEIVFVACCWTCLNFIYRFYLSDLWKWCLGIENLFFLRFQWSNKWLVTKVNFNASIFQIWCPVIFWVLCVCYHFSQLSEYVISTIKKYLLNMLRQMQFIQKIFSATEKLKSSRRGISWSKSCMPTLMLWEIKYSPCHPKWCLGIVNLFFVDFQGSN